MKNKKQIIWIFTTIALLVLLSYSAKAEEILSDPHPGIWCRVAGHRNSRSSA